MDNVSSSSVVPDTRGSNFFRKDRVLRALLPVYLGEELANFLSPHLDRLGYRAANDLDEHAMLANAHPPVLHPRDRLGQDQDWIEYHPSYKALEQAAFEDFQIHAMSLRDGVLGLDRPFPLVAKHAFTYLFNQAEFGLGCPINVTDSAAHLIQRFGSEEAKDLFLPRMLYGTGEDRWQGAQFITEKEGGSDVGSLQMQARKSEGNWRVYGEKWFCSNADANVILLLARPEGAQEGTRGLGLFAVPRELESGERNGYRIVRLKDKLGTRSMATGEIAFEGAFAYQLGELDRGFRHMTEMINTSRLSNGVKSAALMRRAVHDAYVVAQNRTVFGRKLIDQPLGKQQLVKLSLPAEQALSMWMFVASILDDANKECNGAQTKLDLCARLATPLLKFRATRDARKVTQDAMEFRGGCGYIEDFVNPRLVRDALLGSIWEGTSNIIAIDVVRRAIRRQNCLNELVDLLNGKIAEMEDISVSYRSTLSNRLEEVAQFAHEVAEREEEQLYRQVVSALYHICTAVTMAWEAQATGLGERLLWSRLVIEHRLQAYSPVATSSSPSSLVDFLATSGGLELEAANEIIGA